MSSIEHRSNPSGDVWRVRFRHNGSNVARTFVSRPAADHWRNLLDVMTAQHGQDKGPTEALAILDGQKALADDSNSAAAQIDHHITHLTGVTDGTRRRYQTLADKHLRPAFERIPLAQLTRDDVSAWVNELDSVGEWKAKTIRNWHGLLSGALTSAVRDGKISSNPAKGIRLPKDDGREEMVFLTPAEFGLLLDLIPEHHQPLILLLALTGIRWGEATALTVGDLQPATSSARIRQAWKHTDTGRMVLGPPKSERSRRTVAVPPEVFARLAPHVAGKKAGDLVFTAPQGGPLRGGTFHNTVWQRAAVALEVETGKKPRIHDLRHTFASWAIQKNIPLPVIQRQMGHEKITTTADTYGHVARSDFDPLVSMGAEVLANVSRPRPRIASAPI